MRDGRILRFAEAGTDSAGCFCFVPSTRLSPQGAGRIQLKALWGGHTAALQFMLCIQFPIGEGKHAIRSRRLHEDEIVTACTAGNSTEMVLICLYVGLPKHVLHELSLLKYRVRRAFLHKMRPDAMQKSGNFTSEPCDKADDAKCRFRKGV